MKISSFETIIQYFSFLFQFQYEIFTWVFLNLFSINVLHKQILDRSELISSIKQIIFLLRDLLIFPNCACKISFLSFFKDFLITTKADNEHIDHQILFVNYKCLIFDFVFTVFPPRYKYILALWIFISTFHIVGWLKKKRFALASVCYKSSLIVVENAESFSFKSMSFHFLKTQVGR